ncbi:MAG TPA: Lar family restriction alleviation protein [Chthoniobacteraceae bacterium]|nr:Lar family restriction alleviation protein [Chthoniobacteraceae bacterium]
MTPAQAAAETLKPCPFCGEEPEKHFHEASCNVAWLSCDCDLMPKAVGDTREEAIKLWNTRHPEPAPEPSTTLPAESGLYWWRAKEGDTWETLISVIPDSLLPKTTIFEILRPSRAEWMKYRTDKSWPEIYGIGQWLPCLPPESEVRG